MRYELLITDQARQDLLHLPIKTAERITKKLRVIAQSINPLAQAKSLKGEYKGLYRFRIGDYRAIFKIQPNGEIILLQILKISHRKNIYK